MRLSKLEIREFRGIRCLNLDFDDDGILIYGPNGVGKSSVLQAIEFLLTGTVDRLTGEGTGRKPLENDLHHKEASPEDCQVTAILTNVEGNVRIRRNLEDDDLEVLERHGGGIDGDTSEIPLPVRSLQSAMDSKQNVLTREDLLRFIEVPDHQRSEVLNEILRLEEIDEYRKTLQNVESAFSSEKNSAKDDLDDAQTDFYNVLGEEAEEVLESPISSVASDDVALEVVNSLRERYSGDPIENLERNFTENITEPSEPSAHPLSHSSTADSLSAIISRVASFTEAVGDPYEDLIEAIKVLDSRPELQRAIRHQDLIEQGQELIGENPDQCPLCLADWSDGDLVEKLEQRRNKASEAEHQREHIRERAESIERSLRKLQHNVDNLINDLAGDIPDSHEHLDFEISVLEEFSESLSETAEDLTSGDLLDIPHEDLTAEELEAKVFPTDLDSTLEKLENIESNVEEPDDRMAAYRTLVIANDRFEAYQEARDPIDKTKRRYEVAEQVLQDFRAVRKRLLDETLEEILEEFMSLIERFSDQLDIEDKDVIFESTEKAIRLRVPFHDDDMYRPNLLFSEGQQDIMGLAIFLSMSRAVTREDVEIILLDDVLSSVDAEHRANVASILNSEFGEEFQFVFTTHDMVWSRHLRRSKHIHPNNVVHLSSWSYYAGVHQHIDITKPRENIEFHLDNNDLAAAAAWSRKMAEFYTAKGCEAFDVQLRFTDFENLSLKDYLEGLMPVVSRHLRNGSTDGETTLDDSDVRNLLSTIENIQGFIDRNLWGMNKNIHYSRPEAATFSEHELRSNLSSFEEIFDLIYCDDCDNWRSTTNDGIECECSLLIKT